MLAERELQPSPLPTITWAGVFGSDGPEYANKYYRARYYDPKIGRFISEDPIGFSAGDVNLYAYVSNDPATWTDPWGLCPACAIGRIPPWINRMLPYNRSWAPKPPRGQPPAPPRPPAPAPPTWNQRWLDNAFKPLQDALDKFQKGGGKEHWDDANPNTPGWGGGVCKVPDLTPEEQRTQEEWERWCQANPGMCA